MSRSPAKIGDSLDLLLDTICNTFGGILFISMLVVILESSASRQAAHSAPVSEQQQRLAQNRRRLAESSKRLTSLRQAAQSAEHLRQRFSDPDGQRLATDLQSLTGERNNLHERRDANLASLAQTQELINQTAAEMQRLRDTTLAAEQAVIAAKKTLVEEITLRSRTSKLPRQQKTNAKQVPFFLKGGRLTAFASIDANGRLSRNAAESEVKEIDGKQFAEPIAGKGLAVDPDTKNLEPIAQRFSRFKKEQHFLTIVVWPDSFAQFQPVKQAIIRSGFQYQLIPLGANDRIPISEAALNNQTDVQ